MSELSAWVNNPNRNFKAGVDIYHKHKLSTKHDVFYNQMLKALQREKQKPGFKEEEVKPEPIRIRKIEPQPIKKADEKPTDTPVNLRSSKNYVNKLLALSFSDLSFSDKMIFFNSESYFLQKKTLFVANSDIEKEMRSLHAKMKVISPEAQYNAKRQSIIEKLTELEQNKASNWSAIDTWDEPKEFKGTEVEKAVHEAIETQKKIKANQIYIYRAEKMLESMPNETEKQREKRKIRLAEIDKRKKELTDMGQPYKA